MRRLTGSQIGVPRLSDRQHYMRQVVRGTDPALTALVDELHVDNPWMQRRALAAPGQAVLGEQLISPAELRRTLYYHEFIRKSDTFNLCALAF